MNIKHIVFSLCIVLSALHTPSAVFAAPSEAGSAGVLASSFSPLLVDKRVGHLEAFFRTYNSPLEKHAVTFIREADKHNMDWRLVAAIALNQPLVSVSLWGHTMPGVGVYPRELNQVLVLIIGTMESARSLPD